MMDFKNKAFFKLKKKDDYAERVQELLLPEEKIIGSFQSIRDGVVFTDKRIIALDVQGLTGSKKDFTSIPYNKIVAFSVETAGTFDLDSELEVYLSSVGKVKFEFTGETNVAEIARWIAQRVLDD